MQSSMEDAESPNRRRPIACTECRQHKLKCDSYIDYSKPCSRCRRLQLQCTVIGSHKRRKRPTKADLLRELDRLRSGSSQPREHQDSSSSGPTSAENDRKCSAIEHHDLSLLDFQQNPAPNLDIDGAPSRIAYRTNNATVEHAIDQDNNTSSFISPYYPNLMQSPLTSLSLTKGRSIDSIELTAQKIDDCFNLYFTHYSAQVPVVDASQPPNAIFENCSFLFWAIVTIGSRRYTQDPTVFNRLASKIVTLAFQSLWPRQSPVHIVQGLIILCAWPIPVIHLYNETIHTLAGTALQLALQIGLHIDRGGPDFARNQQQIQTSKQVNRALIWHYCQIICQGTSISDGLPPPLIMDPFGSCRAESDGNDILDQIAFRLRVHQVQVNAITKIVSQTMAYTESGTLDALVEIFDSQLSALQSRPREQVDNLQLICGRLHICVLRFLQKDQTDPVGLVELFGVAVSLIETFAQLDTSSDFALYSSFYFSRCLGLAAIVILKLSRNTPQLTINLDRGEQCYFTAIRLLRRRAINSPDLDTKLADILTQLWSSQLIFRDTDGNVDSLQLRIKSRLSMSSFFDCLWWWRQEFAGEPNPFTSQLVSRQQNDSDDPTPSAQHVFDSDRAFSNLFTYDEDYFIFFENGIGATQYP